MRVGVLTGGGDCPGLNAVIRAVGRRVMDRGHGHVPVEQDREPAEHLLLDNPALGRDELADPFGQGLVVRHRCRRWDSNPHEVSPTGF